MKRLNGLTDKEISVLNKIASKSKMDCWFSISEDGCSIDDLEENKKLSLNEGIELLYEGMTGISDYELSDDEIIIFVKLLDADFTKENVKRTTDTKISPLNNLLLIDTFFNGPPAKEMRIELLHYNPDSDLGGQIVRQVAYLFDYELKKYLVNSKTPEDFIVILSEHCYKPELIDKGTNDYNILLPILEEAFFCGKLPKKSQEVLGSFKHYITIDTEPTNDPDKYLLSIYAAFDKMRLFD